MAAKQSMMQVITYATIKAAKAAVMAIKEVEQLVNAARLLQVMLRTGHPALKLPTFDWKAAGK